MSKNSVRVEKYCFQPKETDRILIQLHISVHESEKEKAEEINAKVEKLVEEIKE